MLLFAAARAHAQSIGPKDGFKDCVRYVLPKLLLWPLSHCLRYFDVLVALSATSHDDDDTESLNNAKSMLHPTKMDVERKLQGRRNAG